MHVGLYRSHRGLGRGVGLRHLHRPDTGERGNGFLLPIRRSHGKTIEQQAVCIDNLQTFHGLQLLTSLYLGLLDCIPGLCLYRLQRLSVAALSHTGNQRGFLQFYQECHFLIAVYLQLWLAVRKGIGQQLRMLCRRFYERRVICRPLPGSQSACGEQLQHQQQRHQAGKASLPRVFHVGISFLLGRPGQIAGSCISAQVIDHFWN